MDFSDIELQDTRYDTNQFSMRWVVTIDYIANPDLFSDLFKRVIPAHEIICIKPKKYMIIAYIETTLDKLLYEYMPVMFPCDVNYQRIQNYFLGTITIETTTPLPVIIDFGKFKDTDFYRCTNFKLKNLTISELTLNYKYKVHDRLSGVMPIEFVNCEILHATIHYAIGKHYSDIIQHRQVKYHSVSYIMPDKVVESDKILRTNSSVFKGYKH